MPFTFNNLRNVVDWKNKHTVEDEKGRNCFNLTKSDELLDWICSFALPTNPVQARDFSFTGSYVSVRSKRIRITFVWTNISTLLAILCKKKCVCPFTFETGSEMQTISSTQICFKQICFFLSFSFSLDSNLLSISFKVQISSFFQTNTAFLLPLLPLVGCFYFLHFVLWSLFERTLKSKSICDKQLNLLSLSLVWFTFFLYLLFLQFAKSNCTFFLFFFAQSLFIYHSSLFWKLLRFSKGTLAHSAQLVERKKRLQQRVQFCIQTRFNWLFALLMRFPTVCRNKFRRTFSDEACACHKFTWSRKEQQITTNT